MNTDLLPSPLTADPEFRRAILAVFDALAAIGRIGREAEAGATSETGQDPDGEQKPAQPAKA